MKSIIDIKQRFGIIGNSKKLELAIEKALRVSPTDISVMVTGESGTGKEVIPKIIHQNSVRKHSPYIAVNCGAIPEGTIDSELFGHEKGSFTGATNNRKGYFEVANNGTIFLDEVGELPLSTQVRLLRVLETGEFIKVGASTTQKTNVRIVAATNVDMINAIDKNQFREDLFYRLNTVEINLPPLRQRKEDIELIFRKFSMDFAEKYKMPSIRLTDDAIKLISTYHWPGNIRQLRNLTEQISVIEEKRMINSNILKNYLPHNNNLPVIQNKKNTDNEITEREILYKVLFEMKKDISELKKITNNFLQENDKINISNKSSNEISNDELVKSTIIIPSISKEKIKDEVNIKEPISLQEREIDMIKNVLVKFKGKRNKAAKELGISERTLYRKIKQFKL
jgi:transcriptional regulator with PAS, ATPase and Fis domain